MQFSKKGKELKNTNITYGSFSSMSNKAIQIDFLLHNIGTTAFFKC